MSDERAVVTDGRAEARNRTVMISACGLIVGAMVASRKEHDAQQLKALAFLQEQIDSGAASLQVQVQLAQGQVRVSVAVIDEGKLQNVFEKSILDIFGPFRIDPANIRAEPVPDRKHLN